MREMNDEEEAEVSLMAAIQCILISSVKTMPLSLGSQWEN
jgi:hypothetical protein